MATLTTSAIRKPAQVIARATVQVKIEGRATVAEVLDTGLTALDESRTALFDYGVRNALGQRLSVGTVVEDCTLTVFADRS